MELAAVAFPHRAAIADPELVVAHLSGTGALAGRLGLVPGSSDRHLVSSAHLSWGRDAAGQLVGAFAFAFRVPGEDTVRLARDATGQVPLFYAVTHSGVVVGTDLAAIASDPAVSDEVDLEALAYLYAHAHRPWLRRTGLRAVAKVAPGHVVELRHSVVREFRYWRPERVRADRRTPPERQLDNLDRTLRLAVAESVHGDERIGSHLSGGIDSAVVTAVAQSTAPGVLQAYSWSPTFTAEPRRQGDERDRVLELGRELGVPVRFCGAGSADHLRESWDPVLRPRLALGQEAGVLADASQRGITVMLSGWGGDEGLSAQRPPRRSVTWRGRVRRAVAGIDESTGAVLAEEWRDDWPQVAREVRRGFRRLQAPGSLRRRQLAWLLNGHLAARNESWFAAAVPLGIRYAFPLQDRRLLELVLAVPPELSTSATWSRILMRRIAERYLPGQWVWTRRFKEAPAQYPTPAGGMRGSDREVAALLEHRERAALCLRKRRS